MLNALGHAVDVPLPEVLVVVLEVLVLVSPPEERTAPPHA
jgi:hypothetical protein